MAQELVPVLAHVGFRCVVMDDREAFAYPQVFLQAERTVVGDMEHISDYVDIRSRDYVCVMTRGHQFDYYVQKQAMALHPYYIGIMGSRNKIRVVTDKLLADGFSLEEIQKVPYAYRHGHRSRDSGGNCHQHSRGTDRPQS